MPSQTSASPPWPKSPTLMTMLPASVRRLLASSNSRLKRVLPHSVMTLYPPTMRSSYLPKLMLT